MSKVTLEQIEKKIVDKTFTEKPEKPRPSGRGGCQLFRAVVQNIICPV